jgi:hypothetical protein
MSRIINLSQQIKNDLPLELVDLMQKVAGLADKRQNHLYLVGGMVRELLLTEYIRP